MSNKKLKVAIVGGTGYTGVELLRLLAKHEAVELTAITSRSEAGRSVTELFPSLRDHVKLSFQHPDKTSLLDCDVVFFATPNGTAMSLVAPLLTAGVRVIDLAADFRLKDVNEWKSWYGMDHACPALLAEAVYGLPEVNRDAIKKARLVANPGCYPTAVQLGLKPLLKHMVINPEGIIVDAKSGVSGAGRNAVLGSLFSEAAENLKAYAVPGHRHLPEINQGLSNMSAKPVSMTFVPHLIPMIRGIHATIYSSVTEHDVDLQTLYEDEYTSEQFVDVLPAGSHPETRSVKGSNTCRIAVHRPQGGHTIVVLSIIDNLVKGAAGQAVQNMNIMFGLEEAMGLCDLALVP